MSRYEKRIESVLREHKDGLTTVDVARKADISKTTAIKYLAAFRMAGKANFMEVGPAKLWRLVEKEERKRSILRTKKLDAILEEFTKDADLVGSAIVDEEGLPLSAALPDNLTPDQLGVLSATLFQAGVKSIELADLERLKQIVVEGSRGRIVALNQGKVLLIAFCGPDKLLGPVKLEMEVFAGRLNEILKRG